MHRPTIKITRNLLFEYQCTSGKFIRLPNRIETFLPELECSTTGTSPPPGPRLRILSPRHRRAGVRTDTQSATTGALSLPLPLAAASLLTAGALSRVGGYAGAADERHRMSKRRRTREPDVLRPVRMHRCVRALVLIVAVLRRLRNCRFIE